MTARLCLLFLSLFFIAVRFWAPPGDVFLGRHLFINQDSMMWLGGTGLAAFLAPWMVPSRLERLGASLVRLFLSRTRFFLILLIPSLIGLLYLVNREILNSFPSSADEHSCYFLAECLLRGRLWVEPHPLSEFFNVVHVGNRDGKWFSVYPPGWPLIWALGLGFNLVEWLNPVMVSLGIVFFFAAGRMLFGAPTAFAGLSLMALTPFFMFTGASYFSHGTCFFMVSVFTYAYLKWMRAENESPRLFWASVAALAMGYGLMTRYLTIVALTGPFLAWHYLPLLFRRRAWRQSDITALAILLVFSGLVLWHNYEITGKPFRAPNKYDKSWERLGFRDFYTPVDGMFFILARFFYLMDWVPGVFVVVYLFSLVARRGLDTYQQLFRFAFLYPVIAYFFYFSWGGNQWGPRYYYEGLPFLFITALETLRHGWREGGEGTRKMLIAAVLFVLFTNGYQFFKHGTFHREASAQRKALYVLAEKTLQNPSIVFIHGFLGDKLVLAEEDAVRNSPWLDGKILYAHDLGEKNDRLRRAYPDREYYRGTYDRVQKQPHLERL